MKHEEIEKFNLIDRYLMGKLLVEERVSFEEHFVDCPQCIAHLQTTKNFMQDLRFVAAEQASQIGRHQPKRAFGHFLQMLLGKPLALAMGCLLIAAAVSAFFVMNYMQRLRTEVNQAESLSKQWEQRYENERQSSVLMDKKNQEAQLQQAEQLRALEARLKNEEAQPTESGRLTHSEGNLSVFTLASIRGGGPNTSESINQITIPQSSAIFALTVSLEGELEFKNYRITISDNRRGVVLSRPNFIPDPDSDSLYIWIKRGRLQPGDYSLLVEGFKKEGGKSVIGNYPFSIIKAP
jgi:ABC-type multidrug transport system fused ATPase/permease subunit